MNAGVFGGGVGNKTHIGLSDHSLKILIPWHIRESKATKIALLLQRSAPLFLSSANGAATSSERFSVLAKYWERVG